MELELEDKKNIDTYLEGDYAYIRDLFLNLFT